jgi:tRNA G18 (ribose-2'-O)-methylase SpoU
MMIRMTNVVSLMGGGRSRCGILVVGVKAYVTSNAQSTTSIAPPASRRRRQMGTDFSFISVRKCRLLPFSTVQHSSSTRCGTQRNLSSSYSYDGGGVSNKKKKKDNTGIIYTKTNTMNIISSPESVTAKKIHALLKHKKRREQLQQVVVEGPRIVFDMYRNVHTRQYINRILIDLDLFEEYSEFLQELHNKFPPLPLDHDTNDENHTNDSSTNNETNAAPTNEECTTKQSSSNDHERDKSTSSSKKKYRTIAFHPTYRDVFKACCSDTVTNQGIVAICDIPQHAPLSSTRPKEQRITVVNDNDAAPNRFHEMYLVCDAIQDPGNMGTLIRSAVACGVTAIYILPNACDVWNPKAIRSAMGATFTIPIIEMKHWDDCYRELLHIGCTSSTIYAATMLDTDDGEGTKKNPPPAFNIAHEMKNLTKYTNDTHSGSNISSMGTTKSTAHYDVDWIGASLLRPKEAMNTDISPTDTTPNAPEETSPTKTKKKSRRRPTASALIIGSEGNGLTRNIRSAIEKERIQTVYVPMVMTTAATSLDPNATNHPMMHATPIVESLNAAICGSIILFEYLRQKNTHPLHSSTTNKDDHPHESSPAV